MKATKPHWQWYATCETHPHTFESTRTHKQVARQGDLWLNWFKIRERLVRGCFELATAWWFPHVVECAHHFWAPKCCFCTTFLIFYTAPAKVNWFEKTCSFRCDRILGSITRLMRKWKFWKLLGTVEHLWRQWHDRKAALKLHFRQHWGTAHALALFAAHS